MIPIYLYLVGSSLLGLGFWLGRTSGRASEQRNREQIIDDVVRRRMGWRDTEPDALPVQLGTLAEHQRRLAIAAAPEPTPAPQRRPWLVTTLAYRRAQLLVALDRVVAPLRTSTGRHRAEDMPRLYGTVAQRRHSAAEAQHLAHLAWNTSTKDWPVLVLKAGWSVPKIPATTELGELVSP